MLRLTKNMADGLAVHAGLARLGRWLRRGRDLVLAYHNVIPEATHAGADGSLHLPLARFRQQMTLLRECCAVVSLSEVLETSPPSARPRVAITFDDAYRGAVTLAVPAAVEVGLPVTIFVAPGVLGGRGLWWDVVEFPLPRFEEEREYALTTYAGRDASVRKWAAGAGYELRPVSEMAKSATAEELDAAAQLPGVSLASHSWSHPNLASLTGPELEEELARPLAWLRARTTPTIEAVAWPYGLAKAETTRVAQRLGYRAAFRMNGGLLPQMRPTSFILPRYTVPAGLSPHTFDLRLGGWRLP